MTATSRNDLIAHQGKVVSHCLNLIDLGLRRCDLALKSLQPRQTGQITLFKTVEKSRGKLVLNEVRWRVVRWQKRREHSDGKVEWRAEKLVLSEAVRRVSSHHEFHDTAPQVRKALKAAIALIEWRARVLQTATNFVTGVESHNRCGIPAGMKNIARAVDAAAEGVALKGEIRDAAAEVGRAKAAAKAKAKAKVDLAASAEGPVTA